MRQLTEIKINIDDFPLKSSKKNEYGLNGINLQIYEFFCKKNHAKDVLYKLEYPDYLTLYQHIYSDLEELYAEYGIYFEDGLLAETSARLEVIPKYVFESDLESLKIYLKEKSNQTFGDENVEVRFVVEVNEEEQKNFLDNLSTELREEYIQLLEEYNFLNIYLEFANKKEILNFLQKDPWYCKRNLVNILDFVLKNDCLQERTDYSALIKCYKNLLDECLKIASEDKNVCFYFDESSFDYSTCLVVNAKEKILTFNERIYPFIVSYLKLHNVMCYVEERSYWECYHGIIDTFSRDNLYLSDYLKSLRHPINVGILNYTANGFHTMVTRNTIEPIHLSYRVKCVKVHENTGNTDSPLQVKDAEVFNLHCDDRDIEVLDFRKYYELHTKDFKKGRTESILLFSLLNNIHAILNVKETSLDISNAILFRMKGDLFIGLLEKIDYKVSYTAVSLIKDYNYKNVIEMDESKYATSVLDLRAFDDNSLIVKNSNILQRELPNTSEGFLVSLLCHTAANINETCGLCYDDVGLFGTPTKTCRGVAVNKLLKCGLPLKGLQNTFLTFFGGPHMYLGENVNGVKTPLKIDQNLWRQ